MAENNRVSEILKDIVGELKEIASSQTVIGEPITVGDKTVVPVVKISVGFGAGGGQGEYPSKGGGFGGGGPCPTPAKPSGAHPGWVMEDYREDQRGCRTLSSV